MDTGSYDFKSLESKYDGFLAPAFEIKVGSATLDSAKIPISRLTVDIDAGTSAGGCHFVIESQYDYEKSVWAGGILDKIEVGAKLIIKGGYVQKKEIFYGFVDDYTIEYSSDAAPRITVTGIDAKGYLMNAKDQQYMSEKATSVVVKEILGACVSNGYAKSIDVGPISNFNVQLIQNEIDDYKFLCYLAEMYNLNFFVVDGEIVFKNVMSSTSTLIKLTLGVSLMNFSKTVSVKNQVGKVIVYSIDPLTKKPIKGEADDTSRPGAGSEAGELARGFNKIVESEVNFLVYTPEECKKLAQARFDARAFSLVSGQGRCIGIPEIIPGRYIDLAGFDPDHSDSYFITKVTHEYSIEGGYHTTFGVKGAKTK